MNVPVLRLSMLKKYFPYKKGLFVKAVDGINLEIFPGETLGLVGESAHAMGKHSNECGDYR